MDTEGGTPTLGIIALALLGLVVYGLVTYLVVKAAIVHALRDFLDLAAGKSRQKLYVKTVQDGLRETARLLRTDAVDD